MNKKVAVIITAFFNYDYNIRIKYLEEKLISNGYDIVIVSSDFDHRNKKTYKNNKNNLKLLKVPRYRTNISFNRILSHIFFSRLVFKCCENLKPDLIYAITPPNFIFVYLGLYKQLYPNTRLIYEIEDLWPESLPINNFLKVLIKPLTNIWRYFRDAYLYKADDLVFECKLFQDYLKKKSNSHLIYLTKANTLEKIEIGSLEDTLNFLYLGSVNNLIDINLIIKIMLEVKKHKKVVLYIIGGGEKNDTFLTLLKKNNIDYKNCGFIYSEDEKIKIVRKCHFALNIMKSSVFVGVTMKSLEYFHYGLPIINSIKGDIWDFVEREKCGFNISWNNISQQISNIINVDNKCLGLLSNNSRKIYLTNFSPENFYKKLEFLNL